MPIGKPSTSTARLHLAPYRYSLFLLLLVFLPLSLNGQADSRAELIQQARREKAETLHPPVQGGLEKAMLRAEEAKLIERLTAGLAGLRAQFGGLATGQGFALGPAFLANDWLDGNLTFYTSAVASVAQAYQFQVRGGLPNLAGGRFPIDVSLVHNNFPRMDYYGPGPDTRRGSRTNYLLENTALDLSTGLKPADFLTLGLTGGYLLFNVGPGNRNDVTPSDQVFTPALTPGIQDQTDFWRAGGFVEVDYRDNPGGPRSGGFYSARFLYHDDQEIQRHTFRLLEMELQQYFPFFNGKRVIALRGRTAMTWAGVGQSVPFYMQPYLGGSDDLRGFRSYRFYDDNHVVFNVEYRWESFPGLDMALFFDAGKVVPRRTQINFHDLETSTGFGFRFNARNNVFLRLDFGFSREGFQVWFKFDNPF